MAETLLKSPSCSKCGEDARPQALYCHACGGKIIDLPQDKEENVSSAWFRSEIVDTSGNEESPSAAATERKRVEDDAGQPSAAGEAVAEADTEEAASVSEESLEGSSEDDHRNETRDDSVRIKRKDETSLNTSGSGRDKLRSAAELRRRPKPVRSKRVEVVWEEKSGSPNLLFLLFGLLITVFAGVTLFLAYYLK